MQTNMNTKSCAICGGTDYHTIYEADEEKLRSLNLTSEIFKCTSVHTDFFYSLVRCKICALVMINPRPDDEALLELAENVEDKIYEDEKDGRLQTFNNALAKLDTVFPHTIGTTYLDLSCYFGLFIEILLKNGRDGVGIDVCEEIVKNGNKNLNCERLFVGPMEQWNEILSNRKFDVVTSWDAIEHVISPVDYLNMANKLIKKDGLLVISTMNYSSMFAQLTGRKWPWLMPMHLYYFTPEVMAVALKNAGFKVVKRTTYSHVVSLGYLLYKINSNLPGRFRNFKLLKKIFVPINLGDFMTIYCRKL